MLGRNMPVNAVLSVAPVVDLMDIDHTALQVDDINLTEVLANSDLSVTATELYDRNSAVQGHPSTHLVETREALMKAETNSRTVNTFFDKALTVLPRRGRQKVDLPLTTADTRAVA